MPEGIRIIGAMHPGFDNILTSDAQDFLLQLHRKFNKRRSELQQYRRKIHQGFQSGKQPDFLIETKNVRSMEWQVGNIPDDLQDRRCEITGPVDRKMMINALNSGAKVFMAATTC